MVITQNNCYHKNLLGNEQWRAADSIKHCEKWLPHVVFEKAVISHTNNKILQTWSFFYASNPKAHKFVQQGCLFSCNLAYQLGPKCHRFVILCVMVGYIKWNYRSLTMVSSAFNAHDYFNCCKLLLKFWKGGCLIWKVCLSSLDISHRLTDLTFFYLK